MDDATIRAAVTEDDFTFFLAVVPFVTEDAAEAFLDDEAIEYAGAVLPAPKNGPLFTQYYNLRSERRERVVDES